MILSALRALFAAVFSAFAASVILVAMLLLRSERVYFWLVKFWARVVLGSCGVRITVEGADHVDFSRSHIFVANHGSLFDIPAVVAGIDDDIRIIYKKELERIPFFGWGLNISNVYIPIRREKGQEAMQTIEEARKRISRGGSILMFAEGTRTSDGKLQQFKRGPFTLASRAGVPVVPLTINGSYKILRKGSFRIHPGTITLVLGKPVEPAGENGKQAELVLRDEVRASIERNYNEQ